MGRSILFSLVVVLGLPAIGRADDARVLARLPLERRAEMLAALRVELAGRATLLEGEAPGDEATDASMRAEAAGASHVLWVVFPGGMLAPAEVRVLDVARASAARAMTPTAWDVVDPRVVAVVAASLLEPPLVASSEAPGDVAGGEAIGGEASGGAPVSSSTLAAESANTEEAASEPAGATAPAAEPEPAPDRLVLTEPALGARPARTFSLWLGVGVAHVTNGERVLGTAQTAFYGRVSEWASIGLRLRGAGGYSSIEGGMVELVAGAPSVMVSFRESLGTAAAIELGLHVEGNLFVDWVENRTGGADRVSFGLGVGAFAVLELGRANGIALDYTLEVFGLGGTDTSLRGNATLSYVHRWD